MSGVWNAISTATVHYVMMDTSSILTLVKLVQITAMTVLTYRVVLDAQADSKTKEVRVYVLQEPHYKVEAVLPAQVLMLNVLDVIQAVIVPHAIPDSMYYLIVAILVRLTVSNVLILLLVLNAQADLKLKLARVYARQDITSVSTLV